MPRLVITNLASLVRVDPYKESKASLSIDFPSQLASIAELVARNTVGCYGVLDCRVHEYFVISNHFLQPSRRVLLFLPDMI